jgi:phytoene synthase
MQYLAKYARRSITKGSKSFSFAALAFSRQTYRQATLLYAWCRHADDLLDNAKDAASRAEALQELRREVAAAYASPVDAAAPEHRETPLAAEALRQVVAECSISRRYLDDFLQGMEWDALGHKYTSEDDLNRYCYFVAGTVGGMMAEIMGARTEASRAHAVALGSAMQMTNIARDVSEDLRIGRVYLPEAWLAEAGLTTTQFMLPENRHALGRVVRRLLERADENYSFGLAGIRYLPFRSALAVAIAARIYRQIGWVIQRSHKPLWEGRVVISKPRKILLAFRALSQFAGGTPK